MQWLAVVTVDGAVTINANMKIKLTAGAPGPNEVQINLTNPNAPILTFNAAEAGLTVRYAYKYNVSLTGYSLGYGGTAYAITSRLSLGSSNSLKNFSFEVHGPTGAGDKNPSDIVVDFLTNTLYGCGWPAGELSAVNGPDDLAATGYKRYCEQAGLLLSPVMAEQRSALEYLKWLLDASNADCVYSGDVLRIVPLGDTAVGTYTPYNTPVYAITSDHLLGNADADGPVTATRIRQQDTFNSCPVEYLDSETVDVASKYNVAIAEDIEQSDFERTGEVRKADVFELHCITKATVAQYISRVRAQRSIHVRNKYTFRLGWQFAKLEPLDLVQLTDPLSGLVSAVLRVKRIEENRDDDSFTVTAEEVPVGAFAAPLFTPQTGSGGGQDTAAAPPFANPPVMVVPPLTATRNRQPEIWLGGAGGSKDWAGAQVWLSWDGATYEYQGDIKAAATGSLNADLGAGSPIDGTSTCQVDLRASGQTLASVTSTERDNLETLCWVDGELLAYQTVALASSGIYNLTNLRRGLLGTVGSAHTASSTSRFMKIDERVLRVPVTIDRFGTKAYVKIVSFNTSRTLLQDIATVAPYVLQLPSKKEGAPVVLAAPFKVNFDRFDLTEWEVQQTITNDPGFTQPPTLVLDSPGPVNTKYLTLTTYGDNFSAAEVLLVNRTLIPYDTRKLYALITRLAQQYGGGGGAAPTVGVVAVAADGVSYVQYDTTTVSTLAGVNIYQVNSDPDSIGVAPPTFNLYTAYSKGVANPGLGGSEYSNTPNPLPTGTAFVRLAIVLKLNHDDTASHCGEVQWVEVDDQAPLPGGALVPFTVDASAKIIANTVDANRLRANIIAATHLQVGVSNNQLFNCDWASGAPTVPVDLGGTYVGGWRVIRSVPALLTTAGMNDALARLDGNTNAQNERSLNTVYLYQNNRLISATDSCYYITDYMPVIAGRKYCASVYSGVLRCKATVEIAWYDSAKAFLSNASVNAAGTNDEEKAGGTTLTSYKRIYNAAKAPVNAAYALMWLRKWDTKATHVTSYAFFCRAMWEELPISVDPSDSTEKGPLEPTMWQQAATTVLDQNAIKSNALQTTNYAEDGSGNPTAGAKLSARGTAVKVAPGNLQVSTLNFDSAWYNKTWFARVAVQVPAGGLGSLAYGSAQNVSSVTDSGNNYGTAVNALRITWSAPPPGIVGTPIPFPSAMLMPSSDYRLRLVMVGMGANYADFHMRDESNTNAPRAWNVAVDFYITIHFHFASGYPL
jgi:hypothetical protein